MSDIQWTINMLKESMVEAEQKAWDSLAQYRFQTFGHHAALWANFNRISGANAPNPFSDLVKKAQDHLREENMDRYSLVFLFNPAARKVLLMLKNRGPYPDMLNGVGGKINPGESAIGGAIREAYEETGVDISNTIKPLVECTFPSGVYLAVFYAQVEESLPQQKEDEPIAWYPVELVMNQDFGPFAGEGDVRYFIEAALTAIRNA